MTDPPRRIAGRTDHEGLEVAPAEFVRPPDALVHLAAQPGLATAARELARREEVEPGYRVPPVRLLRLPEAWVETRMCVAIDSDHRYVPDTLRKHGQAEMCGYRRLAPREYELPEQEAEELAGPAFLLGLPAGRNYFHWLFEAVVRWLLAREHLPPEVPLLIPDVGPMERSALAALGVPEERLVVLPHERFVRVGELLVAPRGVRRSTHIFPAAVRAVRERAEPGPGGGRERLFISRAGAGRRRIANEEAMADVLAAHGFRVVRAERLTVAEQVALFARAEVVCGMHGAGLTNAAFAAEDAIVVELQPPDLDDARMALYWNLAAAGGQRYVQVLCAQAPDQGERPHSERDITVDPPHLDAVLRQVLPARG